MSVRTLILPFALTAALTACGTTHHGDHEAHAYTEMSSHDAPAAPEMADGAAATEAMMANMSEEEQAMWAAWTPFMTPGPQHAALASTAGRWNVHIQHKMTPDAPMMESRAAAEFEAFADGRYLIERVSGDSPMGPFEGFGFTGFNNRTGLYFNTWLDNTGTGAMVSEGEGDDHARLIRYTGTFDDPVSGGTTSFRAERRVVNDNTFLYEMWLEMGGQEFKSMTITYTRA
ncbi:MAG: DUF1579 family protein [Planctomycetota bacterium]|jgi:hypothetical protein